MKYSKKEEMIIVLAADDGKTIRDKLQYLCNRWNIQPITTSATQAIHIAKTIKVLAQAAISQE